MSDMLKTAGTIREINRLRAINADLLTVVKWCLEYDGGECLGDHPQRLRFAQTVALTASDAAQPQLRGGARPIRRGNEAPSRAIEHQVSALQEDDEDQPIMSTRSCRRTKWEP